jgi:hypothetical protein
MRVPPLLPTAFLSFLLLAPATAGPAAVPPSGVVTVQASAAVSVITWTPIVGADSYNVYGWVGSTPHLVAQTPAVFAVVPGSYDTFAVTSVIGATESSPQYAQSGTCVRPEVGVPPDVHVDQCPASVGVMPNVDL